MSKEGLQNFLQFLSENKEFSSKLSDSGNIAAFVDYARENGFDVDNREIEEYRNKVVNLFKAKIQKSSKESRQAHSRPGVENFKKLIVLSETDETAAAKIASYNTKDIIAYGKERGLDFNEEDISIFVKEVMENSDELTDEELELTAGGGFGDPLTLRAPGANPPYNVLPPYVK